MFKKLKDAIDKNKARANEKTSKRLGFNTITEYEEWKEEQRVLARKQAFKINRQRAGAKLQKKVIYNRTTTPADRLRDHIDKGRNYLDQFQDSIQPPPAPKKRNQKPKTKSKNKKKKDDFDYSWL